MTMHEVLPQGFLQKFKDWKAKGTRVSVMVHHTPAPQVGDSIAWLRKEGGEIIAPLIDVKPCGDPRDMFTVVAYITPSCRKLP